MSEFQAEAEAPLSTTIDAEATPAASGAGAVPIAEQPSLRADLEEVFKEEKAGAKLEAKPEPKEADKEAPKKDEAVADEATEKPAAEAKEAPAKEAEQTEKATEKPTEKPAEEGEKAENGAVHKEPPKSFLADSRDVWKNVPRVVRRDIEAMNSAHETERGQWRETTQRYESIKPYDDLAKSNGIDLTESLRRVSELENLIQSNPLAGLNRILQEAGPRKADGQPFSLFEVADFIMKQGPDGYQKLVTHRQQDQQQGPSEVDALKDKVAAMEAEMKAGPIIAAFAAKNDRYHELESDIALFLQSGKVPASLSPEDRLAAAYDMAVRINPASNSQARPSAEGEETERRAGDPSAAPSIRSSPGAVTEEVEDEAKGSEESIRESIRKASRSLQRA